MIRGSLICEFLPLDIGLEGVLTDVWWCRDVWESAWVKQMCDNVTWHVFETPPTKVYVCP